MQGIFIILFFIILGFLVKWEKICIIGFGKVIDK
jgi:hypothetical protein